MPPTPLTSPAARPQRPEPIPVVSAASQKPGTTRRLLVEKDASGAVVSTVRRTVLPGGLRVVTEQMAGTRSASIGVWVGVGARDEPPRLSGASHFLEHLLFKGTPSRTAMDISASLDAVGGEFNAFTAQEYTCFHARVLDQDLPLAIDVLGDMLTSSSIDPEDVEAEREVILDEIAMHDDDPEDVTSTLHARLAWGDSPLGRPVAGTEASIRALTRAQIARFYRARYRPENLVVAVAGNLDHTDVVRRVRTAFAAAAAHTDPSLRPAPPRLGGRVRRAAGGEIRATRSLEQANVLLGFHGLTRTDKRRYALSVLNAVLGGGPSSRLFQVVRERHGLAYSVYTYAAHYADAGAFCVAAGCLPTKVDDLLRVVRGELARLADAGITDEELARAQGQLRGGLVLGMEDSAARMSRIAKAELVHDDLPSIDEMIARVEAVTVPQVDALAAEVLRQPEALVVLGPDG